MIPVDGGGTKMPVLHIRAIFRSFQGRLEWYQKQMWNPHYEAPYRKFFCKHFENWQSNCNFCSPHKKIWIKWVTIQILPLLSTDWHPLFFLGVWNFCEGPKWGSPPKKFQLFLLQSFVKTTKVVIYCCLPTVIWRKSGAQRFCPPWIGLRA